MFGLLHGGRPQAGPQLHGGIDRGNIMLAARPQRENPSVIDGIKNITGRCLEDAYLNEGGQMAVYKVDDPTKLGTFVKDGDLIDLNGSIGNYSDIAPGG